MYENLTYEEVLGRILERIPSELDKREGSVIYNAVAPAAAEVFLFYKELDIIINESFCDTASLEYLIRRCAERGIEHRKATKARVGAKIKPGSFNALDSRLKCGQLVFYVVTRIDDENYILECETEGSAGNISDGVLFPVNVTDIIEYAYITGIVAEADDDEDVEALRRRYFDSLDAMAFSGNIVDYKEKVNALSGVGGIKVVSAWNGGGTVKLIIISSDFKEPSGTLITSVKEIMDPEDGNGKGLAPIGHKVSVSGVKNKKVNISFGIELGNNYSYNDLKPFIDKVIDDYFCELCSVWDSKDNIIVRVSQIETRILELDGVIDVFELKLNSESRNLALEADEIPVRGTVNG